MKTLDSQIELRQAHDRLSLGTTLQRWLHRYMGYTFLIPALLFLVVFLVYPILTTILYSFQDVNLGTLLSGNLPFIGGANYHDIFIDPHLRNAITVSLIFTVASVLLQFGIGFALALFFRERFHLNGLMRALIMVGWVLPLIVTGSIFRWMFQQDTGIVNAFLGTTHLMPHPLAWFYNGTTALIAVIIANVWIGVPFNMALLLANLHSISPQLYEAASVDGANAWARFRYITVPLMRAPSLIVLTLGLIYTLNVFDLIYIMTGGGPVDATQVLPLYAFQKTFQFFQLGHGAAITVLIFAFLLIISIFYVILQKQEGATYA